MLNITKVFIAIATVGTVLFFNREQDTENETVETTADNTVKNNSPVLNEELKNDVPSQSDIDQESIRKVMSEMGKRSAEKRRSQKSGV